MSQSLSRRSFLKCAGSGAVSLAAALLTGVSAAAAQPRVMSQPALLDGKAAVELLKENLEDMHKVVEYLLEKETITGGEMVAIIEGVGLIESIPLWAITLLGSLFIWVLALVMILTVYSRFFKLYIATAIAPVPLASFAGQPSSSIGVAFLKSYTAICLEGCVIVLACVIFSAFASTPPAIADSSLAPATIVWNYVGELIFNMLVLVGAIKMSDRLVRELMGLG